MSSLVIRHNANTKSNLQSTLCRNGLTQMVLRFLRNKVTVCVSLGGVVFRKKKKWWIIHGIPLPQKVNKCFESNIFDSKLTFFSTY